jgi:hypothetical protein
MKKMAFIILATVIGMVLIGCANSNYKYGYSGDYLNDPLLKHDVERDRHKY